MKKFKECSSETQEEIIELILKDSYQPNNKINEKIQDKKESKPNHEKQFDELSKETQKEITELFMKDNYNLGKSENKLNEFMLENKSKKQDSSDSSQTQVFDGFRIMKIQEFEAEQRRKNQQFMQMFLNDESKEHKREFADSKTVEHALGIKKAEGDFVSIKFKETQHPEITGTEKNLIEKIKQDEQKYFSHKIENEIKLLKDIAKLGHQINLYE